MEIMIGTDTVGTSLFMGIVPSILLLSCCMVGVPSFGMEYGCQIRTKDLW